MSQPWELARDTIIAELAGILGSGVLESFTPEVRRAVARAAGELGKQAVGMSVDPQRLNEAKSVLLDVKVTAQVEGGTLWSGLGAALANMAAPLVKILAQVFGVRL